jgi:hypothetical protein
VTCAGSFETTTTVACAARNYLVALDAREQPGIQQPDLTDPMQRRARTYTLFVRAYDERQRAVTTGGGERGRKT